MSLSFTFAQIQRFIETAGSTAVRAYQGEAEQLLQLLPSPSTPSARAARYDMMTMTMRPGERIADFLLRFDALRLAAQLTDPACDAFVTNHLMRQLPQQIVRSMILSTISDLISAESTALKAQEDGDMTSGQSNIWLATTERNLVGYKHFKEVLGRLEDIFTDLDDSKAARKAARADLFAMEPLPDESVEDFFIRFDAVRILAEMTPDFCDRAIIDHLRRVLPRAVAGGAWFSSQILSPERIEQLGGQESKGEEPTYDRFREQAERYGKLLRRLDEEEVSVASTQSPRRRTRLLDAERAEMLRRGDCFKCGGHGHISRYCPK